MSGPAEGWVVVVLHLALVVLATGTAVAHLSVEGGGSLTAIAILAVAGGTLLARSVILDMLSHLVAFWSGIVVAWVYAASVSEELSGSPAARLTAVADRARDWLAAPPGPGRDDGGVLLLGALVFGTWVIAYASAWMLYRRGWPLGAVVPPAVTILSILGTRPGTGIAPLVALAIVSTLLLGAHFGFRRRLAWRGRPGSVTVPASRWLGPALPLAMTAVLVIVTLPPTLRDEGLDAATRAIEEPLHTVQGWTERVFGRFSEGNPDQSQTYAQFGDRFELGGALELSDEPAALLRAAEATYLAAYRYDRYDGEGWESSVEDEFRAETPDGQRYSPRMRFAPDQPVALSADVEREREAVSGEIEMLRSEGNLLLTLDTHQETTIPTTVQLSWRTLDGAKFAVDEGERLPPDLRRLANLLREANVRGYLSAEPGSLTGDPVLDAGLTQERRQLGERLLGVDWQPGDDGEVTTIEVSGQLPVYDDVEAVFARETVEGTPYLITGQATTATPEQLAAAGTDYPAWVTDRYVQLPGTVTDRTRALARTIAATADGDSPFAVAVAIQDDLRERIRYVEDIAAPPDGRDVVDHVLFETREGYCEYYASAMVVMLRSLDIPARMVAGYYPAAYDEAEAGFLYRQRNAHAWVEVYFPEYGWIAFEPTASRPARAYGERDAAEPTPAPTREVTPTVAPTEASTAPALTTPTPAVAGTTGERDGAGGAPQGLGTWVFRGLVAVVGLVGTVTAVVAFAWQRGLGGASPLEALWSRVRKAGRWAGVSGDPAMTPIEYADALGRAVPRSSEPARRVAESYTRERYGPMVSDPSDAGPAWEAWRELRRSMIGAWVRRRGRRRR